MRTTFIYALLEPDSDEIRYIGKADDESRRLRAHLNRSDEGSLHRVNWLRALKTQGLKPRQLTIAEVSYDEWEFWERHFIKYFRDCGFDLTNSASGGRGAPDASRSRETREKMRQARLGKKHSSRTVPGNNTSGHVGVYWDKSKRRWRATIGVQGRNTHLGWFKSGEDAQAARKSAVEALEAGGVLPTGPKLRSDNTSGVEGVSQDRKTGKWTAFAQKAGCRYHLGNFHAKEEAIAVRLAALTELKKTGTITCRKRCKVKDLSNKSGGTKCGGN